jgi:hypothetical protein
MYIIVIKNPIQFGLIIDYLSVGLFLGEVAIVSAVANVILMIKEHTGMAHIGSLSKGK